MKRCFDTLVGKLKEPKHVWHLCISQRLSLDHTQEDSIVMVAVHTLEDGGFSWPMAIFYHSSSGKSTTLSLLLLFVQLLLVSSQIPSASLLHV